ncbi:hypothetical protein PI125_g18964 [Phytophthora idaei]|nr:hypothetical protein PI125_g18964 [Phytophthora idaei]KAG3136933.1 hypothetical protein PI126_g17608 [Phytophthora idaei]
MKKMNTNLEKVFGRLRFGETSATLGNNNKASIEWLQYVN